MINNIQISFLIGMLIGMITGGLIVICGYYFGDWLIKRRFDKSEEQEQ